LVNHRWHDNLDELGITYTREVLLFSARVIPNRLLHTTRIGCHV
jgi:hypothetical protein